MEKSSLKRISAIISVYGELAKPSILILVLVTTALGFVLGGSGIKSGTLLFFTLVGAACVCAGASALNHYLERDADSKMLRTKNRPLPRGAISPSNALNYGIVLILTGVVILAVKINLLTAFLSLLTAFLYVLVYTPMKKVTWLNTTIGAIPGAIPPMGGWAAATGELHLGAWALFLIMFFWQHPHFYSIAWLLKDDYRRAGFKMLPTVEPDGKRTFFQILLFSALLVPASLLPTLLGISGKIYLWGSVLAGFYLVFDGILLAKSSSNFAAKRLLKTTVFYLPVLLALVIFDFWF